VGGGSGAYSIAFAQANPKLCADVFDLATVVPIAQSHIAEVGLADRVTTRVGDLRRDGFGAGYDLLLLSAICHMLGPDENQDLLRRAYAALTPGGRVAIQDHVMNDDGTAPRAGASRATIAHAVARTAQRVMIRFMPGTLHQPEGIIKLKAF